MKNSEVIEIRKSKAKNAVFYLKLLIIFLMFIVSSHLISILRANRMINQKMPAEVYSSLPTQSDLTDFILKNYSSSRGLDPLTELNKKLSINGFESVVMKIAPGESIQGSGVIGTQISLRLSPFPADSLPALLNVLEYESPRFYIDSIEVSRIGPESSRLDISLELLLFTL